MTNSQGYDIYIVNFAHHITKEVEYALKHSKKVLYTDLRISKDLESICPGVTNRSQVICKRKSGAVDHDKIAAKVLNAALEDWPVTFALYGDPSTWTIPTNLIRTSAKILGLTVKVLHEISSADALFTDCVKTNTQYQFKKDAILKARHLVYNKFLSEDEINKLLVFCIKNKNRFEESEVISTKSQQVRLDSDYRKSLTMFELGESKEVFVNRIKNLIPDILNDLIYLISFLL